jgi:polyisoprenoid-binding protein YceI
MDQPSFRRGVLAVILAVIVSSGNLLGEKRAVDANHSTLKIRVFKTGLFSPFAHNHEIEAPISQGAADLSAAPGVTLNIDARRLRVLDPDASAKDRAEIQKTMEGPSVLDSERFPQISFRSTRVEQVGTDHWKVRGDLALHGQMNPVVLDVALKDGRYLGSATIKQRDFGISPVSIAGGTVKVKDEVRIEFDITLAQ